MPAELIIRIIADWAVVPIVLIGAYMLVFKVPRGKRFEAYSRVLLAGLTAYFIAKVVGVLYQPSLERPFEILGVEPGAAYLDNPGFPSDHALFVAAITCAVWFETRHRWVTLVLATLVVVVCVGRVVALVHSPADVIAGVGIALVGALWYIATTPPTRRLQANASRRKL